MRVGVRARVAWYPQLGRIAAVDISEWEVQALASRGAVAETKGGRTAKTSHATQPVEIDVTINELVHAQKIYTLADVTVAPGPYLSYGLPGGLVPASSQRRNRLDPRRSASRPKQK